MGYRIGERHKPHQRRTLEATACPATVFVENGATADMAFPCWYQEVHRPERVHPHSRSWHDHIGWPSPSSPDRICQRWDFASNCCTKGHSKCHRECKDLLDLSLFFPIHLTEEGYTKAEVVFSGRPEGVEGEASIDERSDWIVRVLFRAETEDALTDPIEVPYKIRVLRSDGRKHIVTKGVLVVMPGPYDEE